MKRNSYQKPTMKVVILKQRSHMLAGSEGGGVRATRSSYGTASTEDGTEATWE